MYGFIYLVTNTVNGKQYVGQTTRSLKRRWQFHLRSVRGGSKYALHCAIRKYGAAAFKVEQIDSAETLEELNEKEARYVLQLATLAPGGYNLTTGGDGFKVSDETREKQSKTHLSLPRKTHCLRGHPYNDVNTYVDFGRGKHCWICYYLRRGLKLPERLQKYTVIA